MGVYEYKALTRATGKKTKGVIDAENPAQARRKLRDLDLYPTDLRLAPKESVAQAAAGGGASNRRRGGRISSRDLALMTRQLATLMRAGMPLIESLSALMEQTTKPRLQTVIYEVRDRVNGGATLGDALREHPRVFSSFYINMVSAGEVGGALESVLFRLADIQEHQSKLKGQVLSALAYPMFMGMFALAVIVFLMTFIVPRITMIFEKQHADLPRITEILIGASDFLSGYWWLIIGVVFGLFSLWRSWIATEKGKLRWDRMKLKFPVYGGLHLKLVSARFTRTLGTMLQSGLTMMPALDVVRSIIGNAYIESHMDDVKAGVRRGRDLAETGLFPPMMLHMIDLGQRSGEIDEMLIRVADTYDDDVRLTIDAAVGLLEPLIIIIMGIFVGFLVMAILLPILSMSQNIG